MMLLQLVYRNYYLQKGKIKHINTKISNTSIYGWINPSHMIYIILWNGLATEAHWLVNMYFVKGVSRISSNIIVPYVYNFNVSRDTFYIILIILSITQWQSKVWYSQKQFWNLYQNCTYWNKIFMVIDVIYT